MIEYKIEPSTVNYQDIILRVCKKRAVKSLVLTSLNIELMADCVEIIPWEKADKPPAENGYYLVWWVDEQNSDEGFEKAGFSDGKWLNQPPFEATTKKITHYAKINKP